MIQQRKDDEVESSNVDETLMLINKKPSSVCDNELKSISQKKTPTTYVCRHPNKEKKLKSQH